MKRSNNIERNSFIFYKTWWKAIKNLPRDVQGDVLTAIVEYGLTGETTEQLKPITKALLELVKPQIDANNQRFINGSKGGRKDQTETETEPNSNRDETKPEPNPNQTETETGAIMSNDNIISPDGDKKEIKPKGFTKKKPELTLPYTSQEFINTWETLCQQPKWKKKTASALQMSLKKLGKYPEKFAIQLMEDAIAGGYQGVVFNNADIKFQQWQKNASPPRESTRPVKIITSIKDF